MEKIFKMKMLAEVLIFNQQKEIITAKLNQTDMFGKPMVSVFGSVVKDGIGPDEISESLERSAKDHGITLKNIKNNDSIPYIQFFKEDSTEMSDEFKEGADGYITRFYTAELASIDDPELYEKSFKTISSDELLAKISEDIGSIDEERRSFLNYLKTLFANIMVVTYQLK